MPVITYNFSCLYCHTTVPNLNRIASRWRYKCDINIACNLFICVRKQNLIFLEYDFLTIIHSEFEVDKRQLSLNKFKLSAFLLSLIPKMFKLRTLLIAILISIVCINASTVRRSLLENLNSGLKLLGKNDRRPLSNRYYYFKHFNWLLE